MFCEDISAEELPAGLWTHITRQAPSYDIDTIFGARDGSLWVGAGSAFYVLDNERWSRFQYERDVLKNHSPFFVDDDERLYFIDDYDLVIWDDGEMMRYDTTKIGSPASGAVSSDGMLYIRSYHATNGGIFTFDGSTVSRIFESRTRSIAFDSEGRLWATVLGADDGSMHLMVLDNGEWDDLTDDISFMYPVTTNELTVQCAPDGVIWISNLGKYGIFRSGSWEFHDGGGTPVFLKFDITGGVWGYGNRKVYLLDDEGDWIERNSFERGAANVPQFMTVLPDSTIWSFDGENLYTYNGYKLVGYESPYDLASDDVTCLIYSMSGELLCGHGHREVSPVYRDSRGISILRDGEWISGEKFDTVEFKNVFQFEMMPDEEIMTYTDGGFKIYDRFVWDMQDSLDLSNQTDMKWTSDYTMWITTTRGLVEYEGEGPDYDYYFPLDGETAYALDNLFVNDSNVLYMQSVNRDILTFDNESWETVVFDNGETNDFTVDEDDVIWGARQDELAYYDVEWSQWFTVEHLNGGRFIAFDPEGRLWVTSYGKTGYLDDGVFHQVHELDNYSCDAIAFSQDGRIACNLFDGDREEFYGILEFEPSTSVEKGNTSPEAFLTIGNHPNPFNAVTTISFNLTAAANVRIDIFSVSGQNIGTIANRPFSAGYHRIVWDAASYGAAVSSGVYLYRVAAGDKVAAGKMLLLK